MLSKTERAFFVIADISGYTQFLSAVELDHAHDIISDLMDTVVRRLRPPFRLAKFEGDAAFVYAVADKIDGSTLQDVVEATYFAFRRRLRNIRQATTCECEACRKMQDLDLKFVAHHGEFVRHKMAGREELAGRDVIVVHRLLKNEVGEKAYALYSDPCVQAMGVDAIVQGLVAHRESIDIIGELPCWVRDLHEAWRSEQDRQRNEVTRDKAGMVIPLEIAAARPRVWDYFTSPDLRPKWRAMDGIREEAPAGRRGVGVVNHCMHGDHVIVEEVLDWRPYDYLTFTTLVPVPDAPKVLMSYGFRERDDGGTSVEIRLANPKPKDKAFFDHVCGEFRKRIANEFETLRTLLEGQPEPPAAVEEPAPRRP
jgi:uncharacterized protein YndB with AHSA1/START domain